MTIKLPIRQDNVNIQRFKHDMVSIRQGRHEAWLIDTLLRMVSLTTDSPQRNATVITPRWPSVSEFILRSHLTVFCILALPHVTLGVTAKEVNNSIQTAQTSAKADAVQMWSRSGVWNPGICISSL